MKKTTQRRLHRSEASVKRPPPQPQPLAGDIVLIRDVLTDSGQIRIVPDKENMPNGKA